MKKKLPIVRSLLFVSALLTLFALTSCGKPSDAIVAIALHPTNASIVYIATNESVYKTRDGGQHWMPHNAGLKEHVSVVNQFVFDPRDSETIYTATTVGVFRTTDAGRLWDERMVGMKEVHIVVTVAIDPLRPSVLYAGTTGGAYRSLDGGGRWQKINN